jgi:hypothetical protein
MRIDENPSADKFKPPPLPPAPDRGRRRSAWSVLLLIVTSYPVIHWLLSRHASGWLAVAGPLAGFALAILHYANQRPRGNPYSPPTRITR